MYRIYQFILLFFSSFIITSCTKSTKPEELKEKFAKNKIHLNYVVSKLENDKKLDSLLRIKKEIPIVNIKKEFPNEFNLLERSGILACGSHKNALNKQTRIYVFLTNWSNNYPTFLTYNKYDTTETSINYFKKDHYSNIWWGLGNGWQMLQLVKEIDNYKQ